MRYYLYVFSFVITLCAMPAEADNRHVLIGFTQETDATILPTGWQHIRYIGKAHNTIELVREGKETVVRMHSLNSISSLMTRLDVDIRHYPVLTWRWKVDRTVGMALEHRRDRSDCAARVRVIFGSGREKHVFDIPVVKELGSRVGVPMPAMEPPGPAIDYVWGNDTEKGTLIDYPGKRNHKIVVVERGKEQAGRWIREERNLAADFRRFFGSEPPGITAIAVLSDTDQTNEGVEAWYSTILLVKQ
jgi:hypothetical protein